MRSRDDTRAKTPVRPEPLATSVGAEAARRLDPVTPIPVATRALAPGSPPLAIDPPTADTVGPRQVTKEPAP